VTFPQSEVQAAVDRYIDVRRGVDEGRNAWADLLDLFTDDAVYVDPAWGRVEGKDAIAQFFVESMTGLEDWMFPIDLVTVDGDEVLVKFRQVLPGSAADGRPYEQSGLSHLVYGGGGRFRYCGDLLNMAHVMEDLTALAWQPPPGMSAPPRSPNRDFSIPPST
jgi:ketosteroid isomerase-like protein